MNRFCTRSISLLLAVVFLMTAAGISFSVLFKGMDVYAAEGPASIISVDIYGSSGELLDAGIAKGTYIEKMHISISDTGAKADEFNAALDLMAEKKQLLADAEAALTANPGDDALKKAVETARDELAKVSFRVTLSNTFQKGETAITVGRADSLNATSGVMYSIDITNLTYTGLSNKLTLNINYPQMGNTQLGMRSASISLDSLVVNPSSSENYRPGKDDDDSSSSRPDIAPPTPNIIVSEFNYGGQNVAAAGSFALTVRFTNTSKKLPIDNIVMKVGVPEAFTITSSSNTFYVDKMSKESSVERTINLAVKPNAEPISHPVKLSFTFEAVIDEARKQYTSEQEVSIPVAQLDRFSLNPIEMPEMLYVGEGTSITATFTNKGKTPVYNISAEIAGNISQPGQRQFVGNLEGGKEDSVDFMVGANEAGPIAGEVLITYEDANMSSYELRSPFNITAQGFDAPPEDMGAMNPDMMPPEQPLPWYQAIPIWGWMCGGVVLIIFIAFAVKVIRARRDRKLLEEDDEDI